MAIVRASCLSSIAWLVICLAVRFACSSSSHTMTSRFAMRPSAPMRCVYSTAWLRGRRSGHAQPVAHFSSALCLLGPPQNRIAHLARRKRIRFLA
jgi:hypothetical protein